MLLEGRKGYDVIYVKRLLIGNNPSALGTIRGRLEHFLQEMVNVFRNLDLILYLVHEND